MIVGFDVDGVIAKAPLRLDKLLRGGEGEWNRLLSTSLGRFLYANLRFVDKGTREVLCQLQAYGQLIIIATYAFEKHRGEVEKWLKRKEVPFDKLILAREMESSLEFKVRAILEQKCDYFVEDQPTLARNISLAVPAVRVICYKRKEDLSILLKES